MKRFIILIALLAILSGCSWQGQRHQEFQQNQLVVNSEWWSMRFLWVSSGVEAYTKTPFFETGSSLEQSQSDKEAIEALAKTISELASKIPSIE